MYAEWAEGQCEKIRRILNSAREDHTAAVKERIQGVKGMEGVVETTKAMFEVSKVCHCHDLFFLPPPPKKPFFNVQENQINLSDRWHEWKNVLMR